MYDYYPSFKTAVAFTVLFGILLVAHLVEAVTYKITFVWVVIMGVAWEFGGYLARAFSTKNQQSTGIATVTQLLVLLAPLCMSPPFSFSTVLKNMYKRDLDLLTVLLQGSMRLITWSSRA